jgi:hypothetical protein
MWLKPLFARTSKNAKSGLRKWLEVLPRGGEHFNTNDVIYTLTITKIAS